MEKYYAICGLDCAGCEAYQATQANDEAAKLRLVEKWRKEYNSPDMPIEAVTCDGCRATTGRLGGYCSQCPVRACGVDKGVISCGHCTEYDSCQVLADFMKVAPVRENLEEIRRGLNLS